MHVRGPAFYPSALVAVLLALVGCAKQDAKEELVRTPTGTTKTVKAVSARPGNTNGSVFIVEYHKVAKEEARWDRSESRFKSDLERLYRLGFRPVHLHDYLRNKMDLAPGASPVIFTFDDAHPSQFTLMPDGGIDPHCAVGIWQNFASTHADFPICATFYVLPGLWGQKNRVAQKVAMLKKWGCELGSHTMTHAALNKLSATAVQKELAGSQEMIHNLGMTCESIALPYGISPKRAELLGQFSLGGKTYRHRAALLVGSNPAPAPGSRTLKPFRLPRIQGIEGDYGITFWMDKVEEGECKVYVQPR